jgi:two-component system, LytTR family, response regulator
MSKTYKAMIVEDNMAMRQKIREPLADFHPDISVAGEAASVKEAMKLMASGRPDLLFLDITLEGVENGFDLLQLLKPIDFAVIFITADRDHGVRAAKEQLPHRDFIDKNFFDHEFNAAVRTAILKIEEMRSAQHVPTPPRMVINDKIISIPDGDRYITLDVDDILYCATDNALTKEPEGKTKDKLVHVRLRSDIGTKKQSVPLIAMGLNRFEAELGPHGFMRTHRGYLVNMKHVVEWVDTKAEITAKMRDGEPVYVSQTKKAAFKERIGLLQSREGKGKLA